LPSEESDAAMTDGSAAGGSSKGSEESEN